MKKKVVKKAAPAKKRPKARKPVVPKIPGLGQGMPMMGGGGGGMMGGGIP